MQKNKSVVSEEEKKNPVAAWAQFPDPIFEMLCVALTKTSSGGFKHLDTVHDLTVLNLSSFSWGDLKAFDEGSDRGFTVGFLIVGNFEH